MWTLPSVTANAGLMRLLISSLKTLSTFFPAGQATRRPRLSAPPAQTQGNTAQPYVGATTGRPPLSFWSVAIESHFKSFRNFADRQNLTAPAISLCRQAKSHSKRSGSHRSFFSRSFIPPNHRTIGIIPILTPQTRLTACHTSNP